MPVSRGEGQSRGTGVCRVPGTLPDTCDPWSCAGLSPKPSARAREGMGLRESGVTSRPGGWVCLTGNARDTSSIQSGLCQARWPRRVQLGAIRDRAGLPGDITLILVCPLPQLWLLPISPYGAIDQSWEQDFLFLVCYRLCHPHPGWGPHMCPMGLGVQGQSLTAVPPGSRPWTLRGLWAGELLPGVPPTFPHHCQTSMLHTTPPAFPGWGSL